MPTLRVLSVDARPMGRDRAALAALINDAEPDAVCVHNAPHLGRWRNKVAALARGSGRVVVAAGGRRSGANLLFSTLAVDSVTTADRRFAGPGRTKPPGAALAMMRTGGTEVVLAAATLSGNAAERFAQTRELQSAIDGLASADPPGIISALGTDRPGTAAWQALAEQRAAVAGRFFLDERIDVVEATEIGGARFAAVLAVLTV